MNDPQFDGRMFAAGFAEHMTMGGGASEIALWVMQEIERQRGGMTLRDRLAFRLLESSWACDEEPIDAASAYRAADVFLAEMKRQHEAARGTGEEEEE